MNRRPATAEDMTIGAIVFKGNGKVAYRVARVIGPDEMYDGSTRYVVQKLTTTGTAIDTNGSWMLRNFAVES